MLSSLCFRSLWPGALLRLKLLLLLQTRDLRSRRIQAQLCEQCSLLSRTAVTGSLHNMRQTFSEQNPHLVVWCQQRQYLCVRNLGCRVLLCLLEVIVSQRVKAYNHTEMKINAGQPGVQASHELKELSHNKCVFDIHMCALQGRRHDSGSMVQMLQQGIRWPGSLRSVFPCQRENRQGKDLP